MPSAKQIAWRKKFARMSKAGKFRKKKTVKSISPQSRYIDVMGTDLIPRTPYVKKSSSKPTHFYERRKKLSQKKEVDSLVSWKEFKKVQKRALNKTHLVKGSYLFFKLSDGREALVIPSKFSDSWWKNATPKDLHRVFVV